MSTTFHAEPLDGRLQRVKNARDLAGTPTGDGGAIRLHRLLRSASLAAATPQDVLVLREAGVQDVVDLRADWERADAGVVPAGFTTHRLALVPDADRDATHNVLRAGGLPGYYGWILANARHRLVELVHIVAAADEGVLIQCGAGKDRTGIAVALLLDLVGVADEHIGADYARTAAALPALRADLFRTPGYERAINALPRDSMGAPAEAMLTTLRTLRATSGSVRDHLLAGGLDAAALSRLHDRLVGR